MPTPGAMPLALRAAPLGCRGGYGCGRPRTVQSKADLDLGRGVSFLALFGAPNISRAFPEVHWLPLSLSGIDPMRTYACDRCRASTIVGSASNGRRLHEFLESDIVISWIYLESFPVAQFVVRDIEEDVKVRLKRLAERHGRSMEEEIRQILRNAAKESSRPIARIGSRIAARFSGKGLVADLPELRGQVARPADLEQ